MVWGLETDCDLCFMEQESCCFSSVLPPPPFYSSLHFSVFILFSSLILPFGPQQLLIEERDVLLFCGDAPDTWEISMHFTCAMDFFCWISTNLPLPSWPPNHLSESTLGLMENWKPQGAPFIPPLVCWIDHVTPVITNQWMDVTSSNFWFTNRKQHLNYVSFLVFHHLCPSWIFFFCKRLYWSSPTITRTPPTPHRPHPHHRQVQ